MPIYTRRSRASTFRIIPARLSKNDTMVPCTSDTSLPQHTSTSWQSRLEKRGGFGFGFFFAQSLLSCRKLHWSPFEHWPFSFHWWQIPFPPFNATQSRSILDHCSCFNSPVSGVQVSLSKFLIQTPLHHGFQLLIVWNRYLLMNLQIVQFQYGFEFIRLMYSRFVQTFQDIIRWNFCQKP